MTDEKQAQDLRKETGRLRLRHKIYYGHNQYSAQTSAWTEAAHILAQEASRLEGLSMSHRLMKNK